MAIPNLLDKYGITPAKPTSSGLPNLLATKYSPQAQAVAATTTKATASRQASDYANSLPGIVQNTITGLPASIAGSINDQFNSGQQTLDKAAEDKATELVQQPGGQTQSQRLSQALDAGVGFATKLTAPLAPIFGVPISQASNVIANQAANIPKVQQFSNTPSGIVTAHLADIIAKGAMVGGVALGGLDALRPGVPEPVAPRVPVKLPVASEAVADTPIKVNIPNVEKPLPPALKPVVLPKASLADYSKAQGYEPYTPPESLPVIKAGPAAKSDLPTIQTAVPKSTKLGDLTVEPIKETAPETLVAQKALPKTAVKPIEEAVTSRELPTVKETAKPEVAAEIKSEKEVPTPPESEPETGIGRSKLGKDVEASAIEAKLTKGFEGTAEFDKINHADQAAKAADFINTDFEKARAVIRGEEPLPEGLKGTSLAAGMDEYIGKNPDGELANELANSPLLTKNSQAAQELGLSKLFKDDSAAEKLRTIKQNKIAKAGGADKIAKVKGAAVKAAKAVKLSKEDASWDKFLDQITC